MLNFLIFSKDRACQLDLLIRSIRKHCQTPNNITIFYTHSENHKDSYDICFAENKNINWVKEFDFESQVKDLIKMQNICFLTDDTVFFKNFGFIPNLKEEEVFSFRLGYNTYVQDFHSETLQPLLNPDTLVKDVVSWNPNNYPTNFNYGYPFSFDGHVYNSKILVNILKDKQFKSTNDMEGILHNQRNLITKIYANTHSSCVNIPCNNLSGLTEAGKFHPFSNNFLKNAYCSGDRINFISSPILGCHQEVAFEFYNGSL